MRAGTSRERLLAAAQELFAERGYERTTTRDIGDRAGVDAALIARHFAGKAGLYVASLREADDGPVPALTSPGRVAALVDRLDRGGPGPVFQAAVRRHEDSVVQAEAVAELQRRLVVPLLEVASGPAARLRAEVAVAAFAGIALARTAGALPALHEAAAADVITLVDRVLDAVLQQAD